MAENKDLTLDDMIYLAQEDPLSARSYIEKHVSHIASTKYNEGYQKGSEVRESIAVAVRIVTVLIVLVLIGFGIWKIHDNMSKAYETLLTNELNACKAGNLAECMNAVVRARSEYEYDKSDLYAKVYMETTSKPLPDTKFDTVSVSSDGSIEIDLKEFKNIKLYPKGTR